MENGKSFIDTARLLDLLRTPHCPNLKPVMSLDAISHIMLERESQACLDWQAFSARNQHQQLRIVASDLEMGQAVSLGSLEGAWKDPQSLMQCLKASCFLPGLAGSRPVDVKTNSASGTSPMPDFKAFKERMEAALTSNNDRDRVIAAASGLFDHLTDVLDGLLQDLDTSGADTEPAPEGVCPFGHG